VCVCVCVFYFLFYLGVVFFPCSFNGTANFNIGALKDNTILLSLLMHLTLLWGFMTGSAMVAYVGI
jgi:hypothetical protein